MLSHTPWILCCVILMGSIQQPEWLATVLWQDVTWTWQKRWSPKVSKNLTVRLLAHTVAKVLCLCVSKKFISGRSWLLFLLSPLVLSSYLSNRQTNTSTHPHTSTCFCVFFERSIRRWTSGRHAKDCSIVSLKSRVRAVIYVRHSDQWERQCDWQAWWATHRSKIMMSDWQQPFPPSRRDRNRWKMYPQFT